MSKITRTIYNKSKNYFMKKANNIYTKDKTKPKRANLILTLSKQLQKVAKWVFRYELLK